MNTEEAVRHLRADPARRQLVEDAHLDVDVGADAARFAVSAELRELLSMPGADLSKVTSVDLGSGNGIAARAFFCPASAKFSDAELVEMRLVLLNRGLVDPQILPGHNRGAPQPDSPLPCRVAKRLTPVCVF